MIGCFYKKYIYTCHSNNCLMNANNNSVIKYFVLIFYSILLPYTIGKYYFVKHQEYILKNHWLVDRVDLKYINYLLEQVIDSKHAGFY